MTPVVQTAAGNLTLDGGCRHVAADLINQSGWLARAKKYGVV